VNPYRIILADDHAMFRQGIKNILEGAEEMEVVGEADDGLKLLELLKKVTPGSNPGDQNNLSGR